MREIEDLLQNLTILTDFSFKYALDEDAHTAKIWITITFQGGGRLDIFEFATYETGNVIVQKYRYNFIIRDKLIRWDNAPHHKGLASFPHHIHINDGVYETKKLNLKEVLEYLKKHI